MIFIALVIFVLLNLAPKLIQKKKYKLSEENYSWKIPLFKLSGLVLSVLLAFVLTFGITISTKDKFIENKNAIYGFEFNEAMENLGFQDSMKIETINGKTIERVSDVFKSILLESGDVLVSVEKKGIKKGIAISDKDKLTLMQNPKNNPIVPLMFDSNGGNEIIVTTKNFGFSDVKDRFEILWKQAVIFINPNPSAYKGIGGFVAISQINNFRGYLMVLTLNMIIIALLNFLPLPGFSMGNFVISAIETLRKKSYDKKKKRLIEWISIIIIVIVLIMRLR
jgi:hypothetical protein